MPEDLRAIESLMARGALQAAHGECKRFLQQHPTHAAAHEMMGDILYARELWEEAAEWYGLAQQLARSERLRIKRADANQRARQARKGGDATLVDDTETPQRLIWLGIAAAAMLAVIILIGAGIARSGSEDRRPPEPPERTAMDTRPPARSPALTGPSAVRSAADTRAEPRTPTQPRTTTTPARERTEEHWAAEPLERIPPRRPISRTTTTPRPPEPVIDHDEAVIRAVSSLRWDEETAMTGQVSAMVDPFTGYAVIRVLVPRSVPRDGMRERVVLQAYRVARASFQANEVITAMTVQMVRDTDDGERAMLFRGNTTRRAVQRVETGTPDFDMLWDNIFTAVRWNPLAGPDASGVIEGTFERPDGPS